MIKRTSLKTTVKKFNIDVRRVAQFGKKKYKSEGRIFIIYLFLFSYIYENKKQRRVNNYDRYL